jgi:hypothetical protein
LNAAGGHPTDKLVIKCFLRASVLAFAQYVNTLYVNLPSNSSIYSDTEIISELEELYKNFHHDWTPAATKSAMHQEFAQ